MRAAAFQLIRNVLHGCGTLIALRPEDNLAAATVEIVEAAIASGQAEDAIKKRCRIPSIVSDVRVVRASVAETPEHELLGDLLDAQAAKLWPARQSRSTRRCCEARTSRFGSRHLG